MRATTACDAASMTKSRPPDSSDTNTRRTSGAYAMPSGNAGPGTRATIAECAVVHHDHRVVPRRRCVHTVLRGHRQHTRHAGESIEVGEHPPGPYIEHDELPRSHVREEEPAGPGIQALVVEPRRAPGERDVANQPQRRGGPGRRWDRPGPA